MVLTTPEKVIRPLVLFLLLYAGSCNRGTVPVIMTVNGPVPPEEMGVTLVHEHVLVDFIGADSTGYDRWDKENVVRRAAPFIREAEGLGVQTIIECTPAYVGRDPELLRMLSRETGIHILTNTGYYGAQQNRFLPSGFYALSAGELAVLWIDEFENGIEHTGIRPGFIKISVDPDPVLSADHLKIITAAAITHKRTGLVIASHTGPDGPAFEQLRVLDSMGVDRSAFIWVHAQGGTEGGNVRAARSGCWISLDGVDGSGNAQWYTERIIHLKKEGVLHRVLISHDAGWYSPGINNGGDYRGYSDIFTRLIPLLREQGFTTEEVEQLLRKNPVSAFTLRRPKS